jgi:hypothetical protein
VADAIPQMPPQEHLSRDAATGGKGPRGSASRQLCQGPGHGPTPERRDTRSQAAREDDKGGQMAQVHRETARLVELKSMLAAYRQMTIEEAEEGDAGDRQMEIEQEVWRLEQELHARKPVGRAA